MIKRCKNGNIHCKKESSDYQDSHEGNIISFLRELDEVDCYPLGEEFCLGNFDMGIWVWCADNHKKYLVSFADIENIWVNNSRLILTPVDIRPEDLALIYA